MISFITTAPYNCSPVTLEKAFSDAQFLQEKHERLGYTLFKFIDHIDEENRLATRFEHEFNNLPAVLMRLINGNQQPKLEVEYHWDRSPELFEAPENFRGFYTARNNVVDKITVSATIGVIPGDDQDCTHFMDWQIECSMPLVGSTVEKVMKGLISEEYARDAAMAAQMLGEGRLTGA